MENQMKIATTRRILVRQFARELTKEEMRQITGGFRVLVDCQTTSASSCTVCDDEDCGVDD